MLSAWVIFAHDAPSDFSKTRVLRPTAPMLAVPPSAYPQGAGTCSEFQYRYVPSGTPTGLAASRKVIISLQWRKQRPKLSLLCMRNFSSSPHRSAFSSAVSALGNRAIPLVPIALEMCKKRICYTLRNVQIVVVSHSKKRANIEVNTYVQAQGI